MILLNITEKGGSKEGEDIWLKNIYKINELNRFKTSLNDIMKFVDSSK